MMVLMVQTGMAVMWSRFDGCVVWVDNGLLVVGVVVVSVLMCVVILMKLMKLKFGNLSVLLSVCSMCYLVCVLFGSPAVVVTCRV